MPNKKPIIIIAVLSVLALGLGYWVGLPKEGPAVSAKEPTLKEKIVGIYERKDGANSWRTFFLADGVVEVRFKYAHVHAVSSGKWEVNKQDI